jgi:hypothetical protein
MAAESKDPEPIIQRVFIDSQRIYPENDLEGLLQVLDPFSNSQNFNPSLWSSSPEVLEDILYRVYSRIKHYDPMILQSLLLLGNLLSRTQEEDNRIHIVLTHPKLAEESREIVKKVIERVAEETYSDFTGKSVVDIERLSLSIKKPIQEQEKVKQEIPERLKELMREVFGFTLDFEGGITLENPEWEKMLGGNPEYQESIMEISTMFGNYTNFMGQLRLGKYPMINLPENRMTHNESLRELYKTFIRSPIGKDYRRKQEERKEEQIGDFKVPQEHEGSAKIEDFMKLGLPEFFQFLPGRVNYLHIQPYIQRTDIPGGVLSVSYL